VTHVLNTLNKNQLIANLKKFDFRKESLIYLGHVIYEGYDRVDLDKITTIIQWPILTILTEVRTFMGVAQYLRKFIANVFYSSSTIACHDHQWEEFYWSRTQQ
jgi:hypothetical protein